MSLKNKFNRVATDNSQLQEFANQVCDAFDNGEGGFKPVGASDIPVFDITVEEHEGEITVIMSEEDRNDIYEHKYPMIGVHIYDDEEEREYILYFKLKQNIETVSAIVYDYWDSDKNDNTISHLNVILIWDGDEAKISLEVNEFEVGGSTGGTQLYKHTLSSENILSEFNGAIVIITTRETSYIYEQDHSDWRNVIQDLPNILSFIRCGIAE